MHTIIVIAPQTRTRQLVTLLKKHRAVFEEYRLLSTTETGEVLERDTGLEISHVFPARKGGDLQLCGLVCTNSVLAVFFLHDPLSSDPADPDILPFLRACDLNNVPLATNIVTAHALALWLGRKIETDAQAEAESESAPAEAERSALQ
ncbi:MAG: methylglyoxal synthase [Phaeovulum sp.]|uniref:methylglyoxal synthase n=1 Tax=Phaeovulum sp. TaxID=2934796 RepID=UPI00272EEF2A|nr:methylglyoxal synthase [Phaeovulum sp.]MDP2063873.1 methylglyoxal synthase [Phaeovulum sp.]